MKNNRWYMRIETKWVRVVFKQDDRSPNSVSTLASGTDGDWREIIDHISYLIRAVSSVIHEHHLDRNTICRLRAPADDILRNARTSSIWRLRPLSVVWELECGPMAYIPATRHTSALSTRRCRLHITNLDVWVANDECGNSAVERK